MECNARDYSIQNTLQFIYLYSRGNNVSATVKLLSFTYLSDAAKRIANNLFIVVVIFFLSVAFLQKTKTLERKKKLKKKMFYLIHLNENR